MLNSLVSSKKCLEILKRPDYLENTFNFECVAESSNLTSKYSFVSKKKGFLDDLLLSNELIVHME